MHFLRLALPLTLLLTACQNGLSSSRDGGEDTTEEATAEEFFSEEIFAENPIDEDVEGPAAEEGFDEENSEEVLFSEEDTEESTPPTCGDLANDTFGGCEMFLGYGYRSSTQECAPVSGCDCAPHCDHLFENANDCADACRDAGHCDLSKTENNLSMVTAIGPTNPIELDDYCDEILVCGLEATGLAGLMPSFSCSSEISGFCGEGSAATAVCTKAGQTVVDAALLDEICRATLMPGVTWVRCLVYVN